MMMWKYLLSRLLWMALALLGAIVLIFFFTQAIPGNAALARAGLWAKPWVLDSIKKSMGLDQPLHVQFLIYLDHLAHGDLGHSWKTGMSVNQDMAQRLPATLELAFLSIAIAFPLGVLLGTMATVYKGSAIDYLVRGFGIFGNSVAVFWLALLLIYIFFFRLGVAPGPEGRLGILEQPPPRVTGFYTVDSILARDPRLLLESLKYLALPVITLVTVVGAPISRMTYSTVSEVLQSNYIRAATAHGLPRRLIYYKYALKNALIPIVTLSGQSLGFLIAGAVLVEVAFSWPGIGRYAVESMAVADLSPVQAFLILVTAFSMVINLIIDVSYFYLDPRIKGA
jgi:peptide/nickel transport system permease protein